MEAVRSITAGRVDGRDTEHEASAEEYAIVGCVGTLLYVLLAVFVLHGLKLKLKLRTPEGRGQHWMSVLFFKLMLGMCVCEIPRFFCIAVSE
jgi:hypothetical protein